MPRRRRARAAPSLADLANGYLERHARPNKRPKSVRGDEAMLEQHILPALGSQRVNAIDRRANEMLHLSFEDRPYQGNRVLALLSKMFNLASAWGWRSDNPVKGVPKFHEQRRERWLSDTELASLAAAIDAHRNQRAADAVRLQLLTGARIGEVLLSKKADFDLARGVWTKPSHQTKQKRTEHLPLSAQAIALVSSIRERSDPKSEYLIQGEKAGRPLTNLKRFWREVLGQAGIENYRLHDNRHTYASHLVSSGMSLEVVGRLLGHTNASTTQRYAHLADNPLREAANGFADKLEQLGKRSSP